MSALGIVNGSGGMGWGGSMLDPTNRRDDWKTPPGVFEALGLSYDLDPCSSPGGVPWVPARMIYAPPQDGLSLPWFGRVWMNPPYGSETQKWMKRIKAHGDGIALVFNRSDTAWYHDSMETATAFCNVKKRLSFIGNPEKGHNAAAASILIAYGDVCADAVMRCGLGLCVDMRIQRTYAGP